MLNVCRDQTVDVSTVRKWEVYFSSGQIDSEKLLLVEVSMSAACRLLFITEENA